jgi:hypothetical protein
MSESYAYVDLQMLLTYHVELGQAIRSQDYWTILRVGSRLVSLAIGHLIPLEK